MNRLFYVPRAAALKRLSEEFPPESVREAKAREKSRSSEMKTMPFISLKRELIVKGNGKFRPYL